jgi:predicted RNA-binding Zn ribbon-like protein
VHFRASRGISTAAGPTPVPRLVLDDAGLPVAAPSGITADQALTWLARDAIDVLTGPDASRLHQCERDTCGTFFLDTSRGPHRRWCSSKLCGNQARVRAHRARNSS